MMKDKYKLILVGVEVTIVVAAIATFFFLSHAKKDAIQAPIHWDDLPYYKISGGVYAGYQGAEFAFAEVAQFSHAHPECQVLVRTVDMPDGFELGSAGDFEGLEGMVFKCTVYDKGGGVMACFSQMYR